MFLYLLFIEFIRIFTSGNYSSNANPWVHIDGERHAGQSLTLYYSYAA
jgi:hypothetical protein